MTRKRIIGRRISTLANRREVNHELIALSLSSKNRRPVWGQGKFVRHIVFGLFKPISYCGRFVGDVSTAPMPTLIGVTCPTCTRRWNAAMDQRNLSIEEENSKVVEKYRVRLASFHTDDELDDFSSLWYDEVARNAPLRERLTAALLTSGTGIVVADVLDEARTRAGEPRAVEAVPPMTHAAANSGGGK